MLADLWSVEPTQLSIFRTAWIHTKAKLDAITADMVEALRFEGSPANGNNALRTLRRMLHKAREWKILRDVPRFRLFKEEGRYVAYCANTPI